MPKIQKPKLRPAVGFSLSKGFNDSVAVDLKEIAMQQDTVLPQW